MTELFQELRALFLNFRKFCNRVYVDQFCRFEDDSNFFSDDKNSENAIH